VHGAKRFRWLVDNTYPTTYEKFMLGQCAAQLICSCDPHSEYGYHVHAGTSAADVNLQEFRRHGFREPFVVKDSCNLGLKLPKSTLTVDEIADIAGMWLDSIAVPVALRDIGSCADCRRIYHLM